MISNTRYGVLSSSVSIINTVFPILGGYFIDVSEMTTFGFMCYYILVDAYYCLYIWISVFIILIHFLLLLLQYIDVWHCLGYACH